MVNEFDKCPYCGSIIEFGANLCPVCQINFTMVKPKTKELKDDWDKGKSTFKKILKNSHTICEELLNVTKERNLRIFERRERVIENLIKQFPSIKKKLSNDHEITFHAYIIELPHENEEGKFVHDCILHGLSEEFYGLMNFAIGGKQIPGYQGYHVYDLPVFAPEEYGDVLLSKQKKWLDSRFPAGQRTFLVRAEPWSFCDRIYKYPGRWVNWRLVFNVNDIESWMKEHNDTEAPLVAYRFSQFEYSSQFPIAGTREKKEVMLVIINNEEEKKLEKIFEFFKERYGSSFNNTPDKFTISYPTLQDLGLLQDSIFKTILEQDGFLFTHNLEKKIEPALKKDIAKTGYISCVQSDREENKMKKDLIDILIEKHTKASYDDIFHVRQNIPKQIRDKYRVESKGG